MTSEPPRMLRLAEQPIGRGSQAVVYAAVAVMGFMHMGQDTMLLGMVSNNDATTYLHVVIAAVSLILGFMPASAETTA